MGSGPADNGSCDEPHTGARCGPYKATWRWKATAATVATICSYMAKKQCTQILTILQVVLIYNCNLDLLYEPI